MDQRAVEFGEFFAVAWPRIYRTAYAVAGEHPSTHLALNEAFASAYSDWSELSSGDDVESAVASRAVDRVLAALAKAPAIATESALVIGPFVPYGQLIRATPEERARIDALWGELQSLAPEDRADIALTAAGSGEGEQLRFGETHDVRERRLVDFLASVLDEVAVEDGDLNFVMVAGRAHRRRRRMLTLGIAALVAVLIAVPIWLWEPAEETVPLPQAQGSWREVPAAPLSPRWSSTTLWTGSEVLVFGGNSEANCDERGLCTELRDAAAYDPRRDTWRKLADLPFEGVEAAERLGNRVVVMSDDRWWQYDPVGDLWTRLPDPPERTASRISITTSDSALYTVGVAATDPIQVFDLESNGWSTLPPSPLQPQLERRQLVVTPLGLTALGASRNAPPSDPFKFPEVFGEVFDGADWTRLPRSHQQTFSCCWLWGGERIFHNERLPVYAKPGTTKAVRFSGGMYFDPAANSWGFIGEMPTEVGVESAPLYAADGPQVVFGHLIYDDRDQSWTQLPAPAQAPLQLTSAVWADGTLFAFGGANLDAGFDAKTDATNRAWIFTPAPLQTD